jgi:hypothetical protein
MSRQRRNKAAAGQQSVTNAGQDGLADAAAEGMQIPEGYQYLAEDPLHGRISVKIKEMAGALFDEAAQNPNSEASEMVHILLLNQIGNMQPKQLQEEPKMVLTEERRRGIEVKQKNEVNRNKAKQFEIFAAQKALEIERLKAQIKKLETDTEHKQVQLDQTRRVLDQAKAAAENQQPMDHMTIYNKIAEVIGLRPPAGQQLGQ